MMESYHYPECNLTVHVALYTSVTNAATLRQRIVSAATATGPGGDAERDALNFAFINARLITSVLHLRIAIYQAMLASLQGSLRTKTVHSEVLWALNPSNNITDALRRYGVSEATTALFVVRVDSPDLSNVRTLMSDVVCGVLSPLSSLENLTNWAAIKKYYNLNSEPAIKKHAADPIRERIVIDNIVTSAVAMKSIAS